MSEDITNIAGWHTDDHDLLVMDGYDDCIVGVVEQFDRPPIVCYDTFKVLESLMRSGMSEEDSVEWFEFNQLGAGMGESTPCFLTQGDVIKS